jgi:xylulokinase
MGVTQAAGLSLQWFRDQFGGDDLRDADTIGIPVYRLFDDLAAAIPIGAERLLYLPYLMGERTPWLDPDARGVFFGLSAIHERKHLMRAIMEGVGYSMRQCVGILREMDVPLTNGLICGGGAKSPVWRQMLADLYGCTVSTVQNAESATLGAAILGGAGAGLYASVAAGCDACIMTGAAYAPIEEHSKAYAPYYERYTALYGALKGEFKELAGL